MKTINLLKTSIAFSILVMMNSCSKDNKTLSTTNSGRPSHNVDSTKKGLTGTNTIEYTVSPFNDNIIAVSYTDSAGMQVTTGSFEGFSGTKKINISDNPFHALFKVSFKNMRNAGMDYNLSISVNGEIVEFKDLHPSSSQPEYGFTDSLEYTTQVP